MIKNVELLERYKKQEEPKASYKIFYSRVKSQGRDKEKAIICWNFKKDENYKKVEKCRKSRECILIELKAPPMEIGAKINQKLIWKFYTSKKH